jgi:hypothetical protein
VILDVAQRRRPGDVVLLYNFSEPAGSWYGRHARLDITGSTVLTTPGHCQPATLPRALSGADRVWYVHGALLSIMPLDYNLRTEDALREHGHLVDRRAFGGNDPDLKNPGWTLIDLTTGPDTSTPDRPPLPAFGCLMVVPFQR